MSLPNLAPYNARSALRELDQFRIELAGDPRGIFIDVYADITAQVCATLLTSDHGFCQPEWIDQLTGQFAASALQAVLSSVAGEPSPNMAWQLATDPDLDLPPYVRALLGMNAHINVDLPRVVTRYLVDNPEDIDYYRRDYFEIMSILSAALPRVLHLLTDQYSCAMTALMLALPGGEKRTVSAVWWLAFNWRKKMWIAITDLAAEWDTRQWQVRLTEIDQRATDIAHELIKLRAPFHNVRKIGYLPGNR